MKVKAMIAISAIIFAICPLIICAALSGYLVINDANDRGNSIVQSVAQSGSENLQAIIDMVNNDVASISEYPPIKSMSQTETVDVEESGAAKEYIKRFLEENKLATAVSLTDKDGKILAGSNQGNPLVNFDKFSEFPNDALCFDNVTGGTKEASMVIKKQMGSGYLFLWYDIAKKGTMLYNITANSSFYDSNGSIYIVDSRGNWSAGTVVRSDDVGSQFSTDIAGLVTAEASDGVSGIKEYHTSGKNGQDYIATVAKVGGESGLAVIATLPAGKENIFYNAVIIPVVVSVIIIALVSIGVAIGVSTGVTKPLKTIEETLEKIRRGDHEARISNMANNEYGQMSRAFNNLVDEIVISEDRYKVISEMSDNIIFEWNFKTNDVVFSTNFNKKFSYRAPSDHFGDSFLLKAKVHPEDIDRYRRDLDSLEKGKNFESNEYRIKNIYGDFIWVLMRTATLKDMEGNIQKVVGVMVDIDRAKKSEQQLTERASFDALTELYNRETIEGQIDNEISLSEMRHSEMAVLFIDVDNFKHFNDNYSHATGDQVLKFLAKTIKETVDGIGFAGRYGGDEFIAMVRNAETNDPATIAQTLINKLANGFDADIGERLSVSVSIGIAVIKDNYNTRVEYLIGKADDAMYSVKKSGKSNYAFIQ